MKVSLSYFYVLAVTFFVATNAFCVCFDGNFQCRPDVEVSTNQPQDVIQFGVLGRSDSSREKLLKDRLGNKIGSIEIKPDGTEIGKDRLGNKVGEYDPKQNITKDRLGNKVGEGNFLAVLITQAKDR